MINEIFAFTFGGALAFLPETERYLFAVPLVMICYYTSTIERNFTRRFLKGEEGAS